MKETIGTIKAIANDSKVRIDRIVANYEKLEKELTKAKEIMKHLLDWQYDEYKKSETDKELFKVIAEAEQFLKNSEVEK